MEQLMNDVFYNFLISQCEISVPYYAWAFNWIPFQVRKQLLMLLDAWKAAQMRLTWFQSKQTDFSPDVIDLAFQGEAECRQLFELALKKAYWEALRLSDSNEQHGIFEAPKPDLQFWCQVYERETYEARLAAGEPVLLYEGRCCLYGSLRDYVRILIPGPYPGLRYYEVDENALAPEEEYFWTVAQYEKDNPVRMQYAPMPINTSRFGGYPSLDNKRRGCGASIWRA